MTSYLNIGIDAEVAGGVEMMRSGNKTRNILNHFLVGVNKIICRVSVPGINEYIRSIDSGDEEGKMVEVLHQSDLT